MIENFFNENEQHDSVANIRSTTIQGFQERISEAEAQISTLTSEIQESEISINTLNQQILDAENTWT